MSWPRINPNVNPTDVTISWAAPNAGYAVYSKSKNLDVAVKFAEMSAYQAAVAACNLGQPSIVKTGIDVKSKLSDLAKRNLDSFEATKIKQLPYGNYWFSAKMFSEFGKLGSQLLTGQYTGEQFANDIKPTWATNFQDMQIG
jgi:hypothetical protein